MGCSITIVSAIGVPEPPPAKPGSISSITISGTATNTSSVDVTCGCFGDENPRPTPVVNGQWQITVAVPLIDPTFSACQCGETIVVIAQAVAPDGTPCERISLDQIITCPSCPAVTVDAPTVADCAGSLRAVSFTVNVTQPAGQVSVFQWDFGDPSPDYGPAFAVTGSASHTDQHSYPPGNYTARLITVDPVGCPDIIVSITVPSCSCPEIQDITFSEGPCDAQGNRPVTATVVGGPSGAINWQWIGIDPQAQPGGTTYTESLPGGTTHTLVVSIQAGSCIQQLAKSHTVGACGQVVCPAVTAISANPASGTPPLAVAFQATVTNPGAVVGGFQWNFGDGNSLSTPNPTASHTYTSPGTFTASVTVNGPEGCPAATASTTVTVSESGNGHCNFLCNILCDLLLILALVLLVVASVAALVVFCSSSATPQVLVAIAGTAAVGLILLFLWGVLCGRFFCKVLNALSWIFSFIASITGIIGFVMSILGKPCGLGWLSDAAIWGLALAVVGWLHKITGCEIFD